MPKRLVVLIAVCSIPGLLVVGTVVYLLSNAPIYREAEKQCRAEQFLPALTTLGKLSPRGRQSERASNARSYCYHQLAAETFDLARYEKCKEYIDAIPESYYDYDAVARLEKKLNVALSAIEAVREEERIAEARVRAEEAERKAEEERLYGAELEALVRYVDGQVHVTNLNSYDWTDVEFRINSGFLGKGYFLKGMPLTAGEGCTVGILQFANKKGERFNPLAMKAREIMILAKKPNGRSAVQSYQWR